MTEDGLQFGVKMRCVECGQPQGTNHMKWCVLRPLDAPKVVVVDCMGEYPTILATLRNLDISQSSVDNLR